MDANSRIAVPGVSRGCLFAPFGSMWRRASRTGLAASPAFPWQVYCIPSHTARLATLLCYAPRRSFSLWYNECLNVGSMHRQAIQVKIWSYYHERKVRYLR